MISDVNLLEEEWKILLLNQFHDVLPGTSIKAVYDDAYAQLDELVAKLTNNDAKDGWLIKVHIFMHICSKSIYDR